MGRWGPALGPQVIEELHQRVVGIAQQEKIVSGRKLRVDTTVVETNIHFPTDSSLLGDGIRVLTRAMKKIAGLAGGLGTKLRDRTRSVRYRLIEIGRASRSKGKQRKEKLQEAYEKLLAATGRVVAQAKRFAQEVAEGVKRSAEVLQQAALEGLQKELETMIPRVEQVVQQTRTRVFGGDTHAEGKLASLFEPSTEIIRKGKAGKPTEFGKLVKLQEAESQIITDYEVYAKRPSDSDLLVPAIEAHQEQLGCTPRLVAGDAGFYSAKGEAAAAAMGVQRISIPNHSTKSPDRKKQQRKRWFRNGQKWRTGCEGRISVVKRRHGLGRCRYKGEDGMKRWVGLGTVVS
jgi:IS5 family transposase